jgi:hypothetical protein
MKKLVILAILFALLFSFINAFAYEVDLNGEGPNNDVSIYCVFTGQDYLKLVRDNSIDPNSDPYSCKIYRSDDTINWELIKEYKYSGTSSLNSRSPIYGFIPNSVGSDIEISDRIIKINDSYIIIGGGSGLYICDDNLSIRKFIYFHGTIVQISSVGNVGYMLLSTVVSNQLELYCSFNLEDWEVIGSYQSVPFSVGELTLIQSIGTNEAHFQNIYDEPFSLTTATKTSLITQESIKSIRNVIGDYFFATNIPNFSYYIPSDQNGKYLPPFDRKSFSYSKDGVYWATIILPEDVGSIYSIKQIGDKLVIRCGDVYYKYNLAYLAATVPQSDTYVEFNGEILGFDTPPVIEDGRTLVPMRFLFEKMGETVDWEQTTQTATVNAQDGGTISFSIDDNTARVNNTTQTMEVPARLINSKTMVPLRFLSENLGYTVDWNEETNTAVVSK